MDRLKDVSVRRNLLLIRTETGSELFDLRSFQRVKSCTEADTGRIPLSEHGVVLQGALFGFDLLPKLLLQPGRILTLGAGSSPGNVPAWLTAEPASPPPLADWNVLQVRLGTAPIPGRNTHVALDHRLMHYSNGVRENAPRKDIELVLTCAGSVPDQLVVVRETHVSSVISTSPAASFPPTSSMQAVKDFVYVAHDNQLYRVRIPFPKGKPSQTSDEFWTWKPQSSVLSLAESGMTKLEHEVRGVTPPLRFELSCPADGMKVDESQGTITVDNEAIFEAVLEDLELRYRPLPGQPLTPIGMLHAAEQEALPQATHVLGRPPKGLPVAVPVHLYFCDAQGKSGEIHYFVLAELSTARLEAYFIQRDNVPEAGPHDGRAHDGPAHDGPAHGAQEPPASHDGRSGRRRAAGANPRWAELGRRLDELEQRIDMYARMLDEALQKLERENGAER